MKTRSMIEMDFARARRAAKRLDTIADSIMSAQRKASGNTSEITSAWKSDHTTAYITKYEHVNNDIERQVAKLRMAADTIYKIARNTYEAEMAALSIID